MNEDNFMITESTEITINKKGRKKDNEQIIGKKIHDKTESGNIRSKIKNNFHKFIVEFLNAKIREYNKGIQIMKFRKINYKTTNIRNKKYNKELVESKIKELFKYEISLRYKNKSKNQNLKTLNSIYSTELKKFLDMTYEEFFNKIFLNDEHKIGLSNRVIFFSDFIKNEREKALKKIELSENSFLDKLIKLNEFDDYIDNLKNIANNYIDYFKNLKFNGKNSDKRESKTFFIIKKNLCK